jgi:hypothetical protein
MSRKVVTTVVCLLLALNLVGMALNFALPSRAAVAGMKARDLGSDPDFVRAVRSIVEECIVNVNPGWVKC